MSDLSRLPQAWQDSIAKMVNDLPPPPPIPPRVSELIDRSFGLLTSQGERAFSEGRRVLGVVWPRSEEWAPDWEDGQKEPFVRWLDPRTSELVRVELGDVDEPTLRCGEPGSLA